MKRVLFLEDNPGTRDLVSRYLRDENVRLVMASTGQEALALYNVAQIAQEPFDLLVLDVATPMKTGTTVLEEIRAKGDETPAVLFTALHGVEDDARRLRARVEYKPDAVMRIKEIVLGA